ncbi:patched domain-containing protein 3-like [Pollicipes pollicipes]|uniref:patched domain-containing protein 3-like n=1 Tax=Pollicipes pollicipes TaxID=41117 RepID=UPI001884B961|nr:patched domain-containing protein 3-like [Pollicipes pollicipes]
MFLAVPSQGDKPRWYRLLCAGGVSRSDPWREVDNPDHGAMLFFKNTLAKALNKPTVKALVIVSFLLYLAGAIYGCLHVQEGLEKQRLAGPDSYSVQYFQTSAKYFSDFPYRIQVIVEGRLNYSDPKVQQEVETLLQKLESSRFVADKFYTDSWLRDWTGTLEWGGDVLEVDLSTYEKWTESLKRVMLSGPGGTPQLDVAFDETGRHIVASRFIIQIKDVQGETESSLMMEELRTICDQSPLEAEVFDPRFIFFDQYTYVRSITIQSTGIAAIIMCIISLIFIPNPICSLWVAFSILSIEIGVIGYMSLWGVNLDSISMINLIMCIGFSVDFSAHISYAYMSARGKSADKRVEESLYALGLPILLGGLSTIAGVSTLCLAPSYIFEVFFKTTFLVITFGLMHGLFLLPVMLSLCGPGSTLCGFRKRERDSAESASSADPPTYLGPPSLLATGSDKCPNPPLAVAPGALGVYSNEGYSSDSEAVSSESGVEQTASGTSTAELADSDSTRTGA